MTQFEIIDQLCDVTTKQADLIRELTYVVAQSNVVNEEYKEKMMLEKSEIEKDLDVIEYGKRYL